MFDTIKCVICTIHVSEKEIMILGDDHINYMYIYADRIDDDPCLI